MIAPSPALAAEFCCSAPTCCPLACPNPTTSASRTRRSSRWPAQTVPAATNSRMADSPSAGGARPHTASTRCSKISKVSSPAPRLKHPRCPNWPASSSFRRTALPSWRTRRALPAPSRTSSNPRQKPSPAPRTLPSPLDLDTLGAIEDRLAAANVARFVRRRTVCRQGGAGLTVAWETRFISIHELTLELCPGRNPYAEPWLFRRLTRVLDRRMLSLLTQAAELRDAGAFSLNLNVGGVLSPEFLRFDAALPARLRGHTVLDLHPADVMGDVAAFRFACAFARARGHRILLRAVTPPLLGLLDLAALELDFVELRWSPTLVGLDPSALRAGTARWLLARADDEGALRWGRAAGIGLFQGDTIHPALAAPAPTRRALMRA